MKAWLRFIIHWRN